MQHEPSVMMFRWQIMAIAVRTPDRVAASAHMPLMSKSKGRRMQ